MPAVTTTVRGRRPAVRRADRPPGDAIHASDRGAVTIEAALALAGLVLVTTLAAGAVAAVGASVRCTDAARELARLAARGEPDRGRAVAARLAPARAQIVLTIRGDEATAEVTAPAVSALPLHIVGRAVAVLEPGAATAAGNGVGATTPPANGITGAATATTPRGIAGAATPTEIGGAATPTPPAIAGAPP
jgi:hypothetical protein